MPSSRRPWRADRHPATGDPDLAPVGRCDAEQGQRRRRFVRSRPGRRNRAPRRARTSNDTSEKTPRRPRPRRSGLPHRPRCGYGRRSSPSSRPTISRTTRALVRVGVADGSRCGARRGYTVIRSAIAKTSSRRWLMNRTATPGSSSRSTCGTVAAPRARKRRGRLVHDQHAHVLRHGLGDLDRLLLADRQRRAPGARIETTSSAQISAASRSCVAS